MSTGWQKIRLKFFAPSVRKILPSRPKGMRYLGLENIEPGTGKLLLDTEQEQVDSSVVAFDKHSVLFGKLRPYLAKVATPDFGGVASTEMMVFEPANNNNRQFLAYSLLSDEFIKRVSGMTDGAKMPRANPGGVLNLSLCVPPSFEQKRISAYLDKQTAKIDRLMDMRRRQMDLLKEQRAALIQQAVNRGLNPNAPMKDSGLPWLGEIPAHWKVAVLKWQMQIASGDSALTEALLIEPDGISNIPAIGGNGVMGFTAKSNVSSPILAIGRVGALCGNVHFVPPPAWITDNALMVFDVRGYSLEFLWRLLTVLNMNRLANHNAQPLITGTLVKNQRAPLPPLEEQREILEFIQVESAKFDALHAAYARQLELLTEYRAALIHECVTGQRIAGVVAVDVVAVDVVAAGADSGFPPRSTRTATMGSFFCRAHRARLQARLQVNA
ncbi:MAG: restriction endonuclease subunit S [Gallionella sp.]|nr:MAG: restriction endonuclease subunit S [Gallionella sp.]